jgi:hypothetical protein
MFFFKTKYTRTGKKNYSGPFFQKNSNTGLIPGRRHLPYYQEEAVSRLYAPALHGKDGTLEKSLNLC